ncbi:MAG: transcription termination/antitermination protein NusA [Acidobacteria bacterium]|nr:transcription termination/antitermination protein NusA [Acidobacteriota bacterium]
MSNLLIQTIDQISREKNLDPEIIIHAIEDAMVAAAKKYFKTKEEIRARLDRETGVIEIFAVKSIVEEVENPALEIALSEAKELDEDFEAGDMVEIPKPTHGLGRISAQIAKQVIIQRVRDAERERVYENFIEKVGSLLTGTVKRYEDKNVVFEVGEAEAYLPYKEQVPSENYGRGERMRLLVLKVSKSAKEPQILVSRAHPDLVKRLFELEVPEVYEGTVVIKGVVREPGERTKIAVMSREPDVDPVGACVGMKGSRIMTIIKEMRGEKIDIIEWAEDPVDFAVNALSPAEIVRVLIQDPSERVMEVIVDTDNLSLAIGKKGQNVRLAARLIGWHIDIKSEEEKRREIEGDLMGIDEAFAEEEDEKARIEAAAAAAEDTETEEATETAADAALDEVAAGSDETATTAEAAVEEMDHETAATAAQPDEPPAEEAAEDHEETGDTPEDKSAG